MQQQSWLATTLVTVIAFGGGYLAAWHGPSAGRGAAVEAMPDRAAQCFFSPRGGCTAALVAEIAGAEHSIELQGYSFTSEPISAALINARRRGVDVRILLDAAATGDHRHRRFAPRRPASRSISTRNMGWRTTRSS